jgi:predicted nuclease with TOPRIM domain
VETDDVMIQLDSLQEKIEHLIERCQILERDNTDLSAKVRQLESELAQKAEAENQFIKQKNQIRSRIDNLLAKISNADHSQESEIKE